MDGEADRERRRTTDWFASLLPSLRNYLDSEEFAYSPGSYPSLKPETLSPTQEYLGLNRP